MSQSLAEASTPKLSPTIFLMHFRAIRDAQRVADEYKMVVARAQKAAKADGVDLKALKLHFALMKLDEDEAEIVIRHLFDYSRFLEQPLGTQATLFPEAVAAVPDKAQADQAEWAAGDAGYAGGRGGKLRSDNPFPEGSPLYAAWDRSFLRGLKVLAAELRAKEDLKEATADKKSAKVSAADDDDDGAVIPSAGARRGRKPKNGLSTATH